MKNKTLACLLVLLTAFLQLSGAAPSTIVGTWEMVRADGVSPRDIPPWGFANLVVEFDADGQVRRWLPGEEDDSRSASYEYSAAESTLVGWIGLSNDVDSPRRVRFEHDDWLEITLPEGFTATFRRVDRTPDEARCIFFTIEGQNHDPEQVRRIKTQLVRFRPGPTPPGLDGTWTHVLSDDEEGTWESTLRIRDGVATMTVRSLDDPDMPAQERGGPLEVAGNLLRTPALYCGALTSFELTAETLVVSPDEINSVDFRRADRPQPSRPPNTTRR